MARQTNEPSFINVVDLGYLFSAPLIAIIEADFLAASKFVEYIEKYGFKKKKAERSELLGGEGSAQETDEKLGKLKMVSFKMQQPGPHGKPETVVIRIPKLGLIPLPLLQVKDAEFEFGIRILEVIEKPKPITPPDLTREDDENGDDGFVPTDPDRYRWRAMIAQKEEALPWKDVTPRFDANINVKVNMVQADIPTGISTLLNLLGEGNQSQVEKTQTTRPRHPESVGDETSEES